MALLDFNISETGDIIIEQDGGISTDIIGDRDKTLYLRCKVLIEKLFFYNNNNLFITQYIGKKIFNVLLIEQTIENNITNIIINNYPLDIDIIFIKPICLIKNNIAYIYFMYINDKAKPEILNILTINM